MTVRRDETETSDILRHEPWLRRIAGHLTRDPNEADDLVQSTLIRAMDSNATAAPATWLGGVLRNIARSRRRDQRHLIDTRPALGVYKEPVTGDSTERLQQTELGQELASMIAGLPSASCDLLTAHFLDGRTLVEIARAEDLPESTVRRRKQKALGELRDALDRHSDGDRSRWFSALALVGNAGHRTALKASSTGAWWMGGGLVAVLLVLGGLFVAQWNRHDDGGSHELAGFERETSVAVDPERAYQGGVSQGPIATGVSARSRAERVSAVAPASRLMVVEPRRSAVVGAAQVELSIESGGAPLRGASIHVVTQSGSRIAGRTNAKGVARVSYSAGELDGAGYSNAVGMLTVRASAAGFGTSSLFHVGPAYLAGQGATPPIALVPGAGSVEGRLLDEAGVAIADVTVYVIETGSMQQNELATDWITTAGYRRVTTGADGAYHVSGLPPGDWTVSAFVDGRPPAAESFTADLDSVARVELRLRLGAAVDGAVVDVDGAPAAFARVWFDPAALHAPFTHEAIEGYERSRMTVGGATTADADGRFRLEGIPTGPVRIWVQHGAATEQVASHIVSLSEGEVTTWNAELRAARPIRVQITHEDGASPAGNAAAILGGRPPLLWVRLVDIPEDGLITVQDAPASIERFSLLVVTRLMDGRPIHQEDGILRTADVVPVTIRDVPAFQLSGTIFAGDDSELPEAHVVAQRLGPGVPVRLKVKPSGRYTGRLPADVYRVEASVRGRGVVDLGVADLSAGDGIGRECTAPALGHVMPSVAAADRSDGIKFRLMAYTKLFQLDRGFVVLEGPGLFASSADLYSGSYVYEVFRGESMILEHPFEVVAGESTRLPPLR